MSRNQQGAFLQSMEISDPPSVGWRPTFRRRECLVLVVAVVACLVPLYLTTATWDLVQSNDTRSAALAGWTLVTTGDLALDEGWDRQAISWPAEGRGGELYSNRFPGVIALASAAYAGPVAMGLVPGERVAHPYDVPVWPATLVAVLVAAAAAVLTYILFRQMKVPLGAAALGGAFVAVGTPLWSVSASALWTHGATHALLVGVLLASLKGRVVLGAFLALAAVTFRPHLMAAVLVLAVGQKTWRDRLTLSAGGTVGLLLVAGYSFWVFGQPLPAAGYAVGDVLDGPPISSPGSMIANVTDWLVNPDRSVLLFVPALLLGLPRLREAWRAAPGWVRNAALAGAAYAVVQLGLIRASGGTFFFGHRTTIEALVLAAPLLFLSIQRLYARGALARVAIAAALGWSVLTHAYGAWIDMPHDAAERMRWMQVQHMIRGDPSETRPPPPGGAGTSAPAEGLQSTLGIEQRFSVGEVWFMYPRSGHQY